MQKKNKQKTPAKKRTQANQQKQQPRANAAQNKRTAAAKPTPATSKAGPPSAPQKKSGTALGRTLKTKDKYLPYNEKKIKQLKDKRWVVVIDKNTDEELAIVRLTDEKQPNTTYLPTYKKGNKRDTYFKHFVETKDDEGNAIRVDGKKFLENATEYDLSKKELKFLRDKVLNHSKQSQENRNKILILKNKKPRD